MKTIAVPADIRNFLAACGAAETCKQNVSVGKSKTAYRRSLGKAVLLRRVSLGLTHRQVARRMGRVKSWPSIVNLEQGRSTWRRCWEQMLDRLAAALETTKEQLEREAKA